MIDKQEGQPVAAVPEKRIEYMSLRGNFGFHYTVDGALRDVFKHGLLSRMEERKRGLNVRKRASRSPSNNVYFTTRVNDLYFFHEGKLVLDEVLSDVVGVAIDIPDYVKGEGHFAEDDFVDPKKIKALVFIDRHTFEQPSREQSDAFDKYKFGEPLSEDNIKIRVESLRRICQESQVDVPIYGVSGDMHWPERKTRGEIWDMFVKRQRSQKNI